MFTGAAYKAAKINLNGDVKTNARATMENEGEEDDDDDVVAGPELPPDGEEQLPDDDDDEEGRFFGGGLTKNTAAVMNFIDEQDNDETVRLGAHSVELVAKLIGSTQKPEKIDISWLRKLALNFEKRISKNAELRAKFDDKPEKYVQGLYTSW